MVYLVKTAKLSERLGDEAVDELVNWMNQVYDAKKEMDTLRREVREVLQEVREMRLWLIRSCPARDLRTRWDDEGPPL